MIGGTAYGVVLNDLPERERLAAAFAEPPYRAPPRAPVLYVKPRNTFAGDGAWVALPRSVERVTVAATLALTFGAGGEPVAARLALDLSEPHASYYRPAIRERCRDGFLPLGATGPVPSGSETIVTRINGREAHRWSLRRLATPVRDLVAEIASFMSFLPGDLLMVGLPGDAPEAAAGDRIALSCAGYPPLSVALVPEAGA